MQGGFSVGMLLAQFVLVAALACGHGHDAGQRDECDHVRQHHELVEHIRQLPDQIIGQAGTEEDEDNSDDGVGKVCLLAEEIIDIDAAEEVPADDRREREKQQADGHERIAERITEHARERDLRHVRLGDAVDRAVGQRAVAGVERGDDDERRHGQDDERVDEHANHCDRALLVRALDVGQRMRVRRGAHTGLVREQAALGALADSRLECVADAAADDGLRHEGVLEDHAEGLRHVADAGKEHDQTADQIQAGHDRHDLLRDGGDALHAADEDKRRDGGNDQAHDPARDMECILARLTNGVGLYHGAHEAERQNDRDREEAGQELAEAVRECALDVVHRAAEDRAVRLDHTRLLREHRLGIDRRHAEERDDPHPEDRAGAADEDRAAGADDVAGADLRRDGRRQCLERAHAGFVLLAVETELAEEAPPALAEAAHLHEPRADGEIQTRAEQQDDQHIV